MKIAETSHVQAVVAHAVDRAAVSSAE